MNATFSFEVHPEDESIEGNVSAIDPETDKKQEKWVRDQLKAGNEAAWCSVLVKARLEVDGEEFVGTASLGCCSYNSVDELRKDVEPDLQEEAMQNLLTRMEAAVRRGEVADTLLKMDRAAKKKKAQTGKKPESVRLLWLRIENPAIVRIADNDLKSMQNMVGGYVEQLAINDGFVMFMNEDGLAKGLPLNLAATMLAGRNIVGNVFFSRTRGSNLSGLSNEDVKKLFAAAGLPESDATRIIAKDK